MSDDRPNGPDPRVQADSPDTTGHPDLASMELHFTLRAASGEALGVAVERLMALTRDPALFEGHASTRQDGAASAARTQHAHINVPGGSVEVDSRTPASTDGARLAEVPVEEVSNPLPARRSAGMFGSPFRRLAAAVVAAICVGVVAGLVQAQRQAGAGLTDAQASYASTPAESTPRTSLPGDVQKGAAVSKTAEREPAAPAPRAKTSRSVTTAATASASSAKPASGARATAASRAAAPMSYGEIEVMSTPSDAKVSIDNRGAGKTPLLLDRWPVGSHTIKIEKRGYEQSTSTIVIRGGKRAKVKVDLTRKR